MKKIWRFVGRAFIGVVLVGMVFVGLCFPYYKTEGFSYGAVLVAAMGCPFYQDWVLVAYKLENAVTNGAYDEEVDYWEKRLKDRENRATQ